MIGGVVSPAADATCPDQETVIRHADVRARAWRYAEYEVHVYFRFRALPGGCFLYPGRRGFSVLGWSSAGG